MAAATPRPRARITLEMLQKVDKQLIRDTFWKWKAERDEKIKEKEAKEKEEKEAKEKEKQRERLSRRARRNSKKKSKAATSSTPAAPSTSSPTPPTNVPGTAESLNKKNAKKATKLTEEEEQEIVEHMETMYLEDMDILTPDQQIFITHEKDVLEFENILDTLKDSERNVTGSKEPELEALLDELYPVDTEPDPVN